MNYEIVIFSYDDSDLLKGVLNSALHSNARRITLIGGGKLPYDYIFGIKDDRFQFIKQNSRLGKPKSVIEAISIVREDVVAMVSGDILIDNDDILDYLASKFSDDTGVVFARIEPIKDTGLFNKIFRVLWIVNDYQIRYKLSKGLPAHAGEILFVRKELLFGYKGEINEDAFFCNIAYKMGYKIKYSNEVKIRCIPPRNLNDYLNQRRRINYGHWELKLEGNDPYSLSTISLANIRHSFNILLFVIKDDPNVLPSLILLIFMEGLSSLLARIDLWLGREYGIWRLISR